MQAPDPIEIIMARLMPPALSQDGQTQMDAMIDDLAGPENIIEISSKGWLVRCMIGGGIAAAVGALAAVIPMIHRAPQASFSHPASPAGLVLVNESDRIESMTDEGWREDSEGSAMHSVRLKATRENNVRDEETGMVVRISEPREEIMMMPISAFGEPPKPVPGEMVQASLLPTDGNGPVRVVNVAEKSASFSAEEGCAVVRRDGNIYQVKINGTKDEAIYAGDLHKNDTLEKVPESWRRRIQVLCRTLDQALDGSLMSERQPRPRLVPPVSQKP